VFSGQGISGDDGSGDCGWLRQHSEGEVKRKGPPECESTPWEAGVRGPRRFAEPRVSESGQPRRASPGTRSTPANCESLRQSTGGPVPPPFLDGDRGKRNTRLREAIPVFSRDELSVVAFPSLRCCGEGRLWAAVTLGEGIRGELSSG